MPGGGRLTLATDCIALTPKSEVNLPAGSYVRLTVSDTGEGMDAATLARAVEPFFTTKQLGRGTGLGLSMVHGLTAQLGGAFVLDSMAGQGTRAELYLPVAEGCTTAAPGIAHERSPAPSRALSVLLVDDEELVRSGTAEMLRSLGHHVREARGGEEAIVILANDPSVEVVVTDYKMPHMDGAELARRVRETRPSLPMLLISGYTGAADPIEGLPRLDKPFGLVELAEALRVLQDPAGAAPAPDMPAAV